MAIYSQPIFLDLTDYYIHMCKETCMSIINYVRLTWFGGGGGVMSRETVTVPTVDVMWGMSCGTVLVVDVVMLWKGREILYSAYVVVVVVGLKRPSQCCI